MKAGDQWTCDKCGGGIDNIDQANVEYYVIAPKYNKGGGLQLVHNKCLSKFEDSTYILNDLPLSSWLGSDGLTNFLVMLEDEIVPKAEVIEMIKRLHVQNYEKARPYLQQALSDGTLETNLPSGYYVQSDLDYIIKKYSN